MEKKAEAYSKYNKAAVAEMTIKMLPELAAKVAEPLGQIDKITIIGGGDGSNGIEQVAGNVPVVMAKVFESVKEATGIDLTSIVNAESYDAKVNRNVNLTGIKDTVAISGGSKSDTDADKTENSGIDSDLSGENAEVIRSLAENANQESADSNHRKHTPGFWRATSSLHYSYPSRCKAHIHASYKGRCPDNHPYWLSPRKPPKPS